MPSQYIVAATLLLLASSLSTPAQATLPAGCIPHSPQPTGSPSTWQMLLPTVSLGVDLHPQRGFIANKETRHQGLSTPQAPTSEAGQHQSHRDQLLRWTLNLSWSGQPPSAPPPTNPRDTPAMLHCQQLLELRAERPADLDSAIDHWTKTQALQALLKPAQQTEVSR